MDFINTIDRRESNYSDNLNENGDCIANFWILVNDRNLALVENVLHVVCEYYYYYYHNGKRSNESETDAYIEEVTYPERCNNSYLTLKPGSYTQTMPETIITPANQTNTGSKQVGLPVLSLLIINILSITLY